MLSGAAPAPAPKFGMPLQCRLGRDCAIQSYLDTDPTAGVRDYRCGGRTYDAHNGIDFRLHGMTQQRAGVNILAAAPGTVARVRDGVPDRSIRAPGAVPVAGQECGNGVVIDHGGGWQSQYCHMANGSIAVRPGQPVAAGAVLGRVGLSGFTEFPHLHFSVREADRIVDPFAAGAKSCGGGRSLWAASTGLAQAYHRGEVLNAGFAGGAVDLPALLEAGSEPSPRPGRATPLVAFVQAIGLEGGDVQRIALLGPDGAVISENIAAPINRDKAETLLFAGKKPPAGGWPAGTYVARYSVLRNGATALETRFQLRL